MNLNADLEIKFLECGIDIDVGYSTLLGVHFDLNVETFTSQQTLIKLDQCNLINKNYKTGLYEINVDIFKEPNLDWLDDYRGLFRGISPGSMGDRQGVAKKMKKLMKTSKYTPEEILAATSWYINNTDPRYVMRAHYFIDKNGSSTLGATLEEADFGELTDDLFNNTL